MSPRADLDELEQLAITAEQARRRVTAGPMPLSAGEADRAYAAASAFQSAMKPQVALALVAELRAAREAIEACGLVDRWPPTPRKLRDALAAYDRAVSP